jgi:hypothetical protein
MEIRCRCTFMPIFFQQAVHVFYDDKRCYSYIFGWSLIRSARDSMTFDLQCGASQEYCLYIVLISIYLGWVRNEL